MSQWDTWMKMLNDEMKERRKNEYFVLVCGQPIPKKDLGVTYQYGTRSIPNKEVL